jgi:hypothetical protein
VAPASPPRDAVQACKAPTSGRGVERPDSAGHVDEAQHDGVGANRTLTNGQGFDAPPTAPAPPAELTTATPSRSSSASGVEERLEAPAAECVVAASVEADTSSDEASNAEVATEGAQKFVNRSALDHGQSKATNLAELKRQARGQLEYQFGSAMSDQRIAEELNFLRHWEAGRYSMTEHSREQRAALVEWRRLKRGHNCTPVPEVARRRVPSVDDLPRTLARYDGHGQ